MMLGLPFRVHANPQALLIQIKGGPAAGETLVDRMNGVQRDPRLIEGVLANLPLMAGVSRHCVRQLSTQSRLVMAKRGEAVVRRGERVPGVFGLAYGALKKRLNRPAGGELVLALVNPGDTFAEAPALLECESKADIVAIADSMMVVINAGCVAVQAQSDPRFARNLAHALARRVDAMIGELERGTRPALHRVALYVDSLAQPDGVARLPVSKTLVAARLDMKKETLSRSLQELVLRGLVRVDRREIRILDRAALHAISR